MVGCTMFTYVTSSVKNSLFFGSPLTLGMLWKYKDTEREIPSNESFYVKIGGPRHKHIANSQTVQQVQAKASAKT